MADSDKDLDEAVKRQYQAAQDEHNRLRNEYDRSVRDLRNGEGQRIHGGSLSTPFGAFKRFIDENLATFTDNFKNLPSNMSELRANMQQEQRRQQEVEQDISRRWTGSSDSPDHVAMEVARVSKEEQENASEEAQFLLAQAAEQNAHVPLHKIKALYEDREAGFGLLDQLASPLLALGGTWYYMPETGDTLPTASNWSLLGSPSPRWLSVDWFKRSPYSPVRLEAHPDLQGEGSKWRDAFEDLMLAALDKPLSSGYYGPAPFCRGVDWVINMQLAGVLPPLLPRFYGDVKARRVLEHTTTLDVIGRCNAPWGAERSLPWLDPLTRDFADLRSEIAVSEMIVEDGMMPETELDMYQQQHPNEQVQHNKKQALQDYQQQLMLLEQQNSKRLALARQEQDALNAAFPPENDDDEDDDGDDFDDVEFDDEDEDDDSPDAADADLLANEHRRQAVQAFERQRRRENAGLHLSGDRKVDFEDATALFARYIVEGDVDSASKVLNAWYNHYRETRTGGMFAEAVSDRVDVRQEGWSHVAEAMRRSEIPRGEAMGDELRWLGERDGLFERLDRVREGGKELGLESGRVAVRFLGDEELEEYVEGLEQQRENLERMVGEKTEMKLVDKVEKPVAEEWRRPDVLSALTTTQTTRLPDGTVTTKVVLKKRFADGREESSESVHTHHEGVEAEMRRRVEEEEGQRKSRKGKGWFWT